ncbi:MAG TPA: tRNA (adenosine(37)-N6)-threonylcarbamoyltransferase complex dimerization subunit type 1 TsaB [Pyrinomonadaceae bacterium]|nr:tRNA (adenosine(37)-N6)-threonylcarbamoyltransferase complex dimerization subunit type 1 TsaB [Pyrinomonadaceae bacterium]
MDEVPLILSLETATLGGSVWLGRRDIQLSARKGDPAISQSNTLLRDIDDCLEEAELSLDHVDLFACASGPGSFTGLRIGISTLKALAATLERPCIGIPTLSAVAHSAGISSATVALLPAGRGEVFAQMYSAAKFSGELVVEALDAPAHLSPDKLIDRYQTFPNLRWTGSGAELHREKIERAAQTRSIVFQNVTNDETLKTEFSGWELARQDPNLARHVAALAKQAFQQGLTQRPEELQAIYVRPSDAELAK